MQGFLTLLGKEISRFRKVGFQTLLAPLLTSLLFLLIFSHVLEEHVEVFPKVRYTAFLIPGLAMMSALQNAFANSSSSLIQSKITGNIVFLLLSPLSYREVFLAYTAASAARGIVVGCGVLAATFWMADLPISHLPWIAIFALIGSCLMGSIGIIAGIWAEKFDQLAAFQNFIVLPLTMLSGVFYSIHTLPPLWQTISEFNPVFSLIDGFRYGFFGVSDISPYQSLLVAAIWLAVVSFITLRLLKSGYKLRQ